jgi:hypothetical protein
MADLNALIAQGAQFNLPNPVDQYSKVMQLQSAQQQMQMNRQQMQQIQEDRAGFAKLRAALAQKNLTPEQYRLALIDSPDPKMQQMGVELGLRQTRLDELDKALGGGVKPPMAPAEAPVAVPVEAPAPMVAPKREMFVTKDSSGRSRYLVDGNEVSPQDYQSMQAGVVIGAAPAARPNAFELPIIDNALAAQVAQPPAAAPVANALVAQPAVGNAMAAKQARIAQINKDLATLTKPQYYDLDGVKGRIANLDRELKQLTESPVGKPDTKDFTVKSLAAYAASGDLNDLIPKTDERLAFDKTKFEWEKANPGKEIKEVNQGGVTNYFAVDKRTGLASPVTVAGGKILTGTDMASQRLAFDRAKFAWEKSNPGFTIQQAEDGSIVGVNNRTLQAYPVNLNAGPPPSTAPFTGGGVSGGAPSVSGAGRGSVGVTDGQMPLAAPTSVPLKGKGSQATEGERKAATLLQRLEFSESQLTEALVNNPDAAKPGVFASAVAMLSTPLANSLTPEARQQVQSAQLDILDAALTLGTGAAYTRDQLEGYRESYFPQLGDKPNAIKDKQARLENVINAAKIAAGKAAKLVPAPPAPAVAGGSSAMSAADAILNKGRR